MDIKRVPIKVNITPSEYSGRSIRLGSPQTDIRDKMAQRMREFEEESRKWREQFMSNSGLTSIDHRPRMCVNFPEFPELSNTTTRTSSSSSSSAAASSSQLGRSGSGLFGSPLTSSTQTHKSFIEEDNDGNKRYKLQFDVGDFQPHELQVKTEGRILIVKGDRELVAGSATESKQFNREITLPDFIEPTSVTSYLSDGQLFVESPVIVERFGITNSSNHSSIANSSFNATPYSSLRRSPFRETVSPSRTLLTTTTTSNTLGNTNLIPSRCAPPPSNDHNSNFQSHHIFNDGLTTTTTTTNQTPNTSIGTITNSIATYKFNMSEFRPEDISITVTDTTLKIHAVREENDPRGAGKTYREFKRELGLPHGADVKRLKNSLQSDGILYIEIPVQDNSNLRPPQTPSTITNLKKELNNLSLVDNRKTEISHLGSSSSSGGAIGGGGLSSSLSTLDNTLVNERVNIGDKELKITFDLTGYKPEDINIKVTDNTLKVHAVHIDNSRGNQIHREYSRSYILPDWVNPELLRARMSDNGTLTVEVPLPQVQPSKLERVIKIQQI